METTSEFSLIEIYRIMLPTKFNRFIIEQQSIVSSKIEALL